MISLNFKDIEFPVQADEIVLQRFERQNPSIALCISEWKGKLSPVYVTDKEIAEGRQMIDLLLISDEEKQHYCWIKNMSQLVSQRTKIIVQHLSVDGVFPILRISNQIMTII